MAEQLQGKSSRDPIPQGGGGDGTAERSLGQGFPLGWLEPRPCIRGCRAPLESLNSHIPVEAQRNFTFRGIHSRDSTFTKFPDKSDLSTTSSIFIIL